VGALADQVGFDGDFAGTRQRLLDAGMAGAVAEVRAQTSQILADFRTTLGCGTAHASAACDLPIRFDYQVIRVLSPAQVYAQMVLGFELQRADPRWVGVNLVAPEDNIVSLEDYRLHMAMLGYLHRVYPDGHITLHAGELVPGLVPPADLRFHIRSAIEQGKAQEMRRRHVLAEIALTSNRQILGLFGRRSQFTFYRAHGVPMTLATDDEGVERTDLSTQYRTAFGEFHLHYADLKTLSENALAYGFLQPAAKRAAQLALDADFARFERRYGARR
jgi:adenosine deaminase